MKTGIKTVALALVVCLGCGPLSAQTTPECTEADQLALATCLTQAEAACLAVTPQCQKQPISLEELNAAIDEKCGECSEGSEQLPKNYGKYRSCVVSVVNVLETFALIDAETRQAVLAKSKACRALIKGNRGNQGNKGGNGKGKQ